MRIFTTLFLISFTCTSFAQDYFFKKEQSVAVQVNEKTLLNPWTGGLNAVQVSKADFNLDGVEDLFVYDKTTNKVSTFIATESNGAFYFKYDPKFESLFPVINGWVFLVDYNNDGKKDIFCGVNAGDVKAYKNTSSSEGHIKFELVKAQVLTLGLSGILPLYVSQTDIPSFTDVDNDGDIDMLAFDPSGGHYVQYHKNQSIEKYGHSDSLDFKRIGDCWGNFMKTEICNQMEFGVNCGSGERKRVQHTGSTILALDLDDDGDKDVIAGSVSCPNINMLLNQGNSAIGNFNSSTENFPNSTERPLLDNFLAAYYEDVDFDGRKDLLISPNLSFNEGNLTPFHESLWFYKNEGTTVPDFRLTNKGFLQNEMIDLGEYTYPSLADVNGDGDLDLVVGNGGRIQADGSFYSTLSLFENVGIREVPSFKLVNSDYLGLSAFNYQNIKPAFYDINKDGKLDFVYTASNSSTLRASISYIINTASSGISVDKNNSADLNFSFNNYDSPALADVDKDGDMDILLGKSQGRLEYYNNEGSNTNPTFTLVSNKAGGIDNSILAKNLAPVIANIDRDNAEELLLSDREGNFRISYDWQSSLEATFITQQDFLYNEITDKYEAAIVGKEVFPAVGDLNNDGFAEIILGTNAGGLIFLKNEKAVLGENNDFVANFEVFPNPASQKIIVRSAAKGVIDLISMTGQKILTKTIIDQVDNEINTSFLAKGVYILKFQNSSKRQVKKLIID